MNQKLIIEAYKSIEYKGGKKLGNITVQINPDSYKLSKSTSYKKDESIKEDKQLPEYKHTNPSTLSFDIHFDGTGIIPTGKKTVTERIKDLENIIFLPSAEIDPPSPCFLKVIWGSLIFKGRLTSLNWDYTLFSPNGNPLRAKGSLSLTEAISSRETQAKKKNQKAEGKFVTFKQGDSLIGLCAKEYKNSGYAPMIASINNLISFRDIKPGTQLWFPKI